jgi:alpha-tubulin suppressor-like RCC1 family protein
VCDTGFVLNGTSTGCDDTDECRPTANPPLGGCDGNATCANTVGGHTCTCNTGFIGDGLACIVANCTAFVPGPNRIVFPTTSVALNETVTVSCVPGFELTGTGVSTPKCITPAHFTEAQACTRVVCGVYPLTSELIATPAGNVSFESTVQLSCSPGFELVGLGSATPECGAGAVYAAGKTCSRKQCQAYVPPENGSVAPTTAVNFTQTVTISCETGYALSAAGAAQPTCNSSALFPAGKTCDIKECPAYVAPGNGAVIPGGTRNFTQNVTIACDSGYQNSASGAVSPVCQASQTYTAGITCEPISCGAFSAPANGSVVPTSARNYTQSVVLSCNSGFILTTTPGATTTPTCQANGNFTVGQTCVDIDECTAAEFQCTRTAVAGAGTIVFYGNGTGFSAWTTGMPLSRSTGRVTSGPFETPVRIPIPHGATRTEGRFGHTLSLVGGALYVAGDNTFGQLGLGSSGDGIKPATLLSFAWGSAIKEFTTGVYTSGVVLVDNRVFVFGRQNWLAAPYSGLGHTAGGNLVTPTEITIPAEQFTSVISIALGEFGGFVLRSSGRVYAFGGQGIWGQLGTASTTFKMTPTPLTFQSGVVVKQVLARRDSTLFRDHTNTLWGVGRTAASGVNVDGTFDTVVRAIVLPNGAKATPAMSVSGAGDTLVLGSDNKIYGWGPNTLGLLTFNPSTPTPFPLPTELVFAAHFQGAIDAVSIGPTAGVVRTKANLAWVWGANSNGELGTGDTTAHPAPVLSIGATCFTPTIAGCAPNATCANFHGGHTCTCLPGFTGDGNTCGAISCGTYTAPANGTVPQTSPIAYTVSVNIVCDAGFMPSTVGTSAPVCQANGTFSQGVTCEPRDCGLYPSIGNGTVSPTGASITFPSAVTLECTTGYTLTGLGSSSPQCNTTGLFDLAKSCTAVVCGAYPVSTHQIASPATSLSFADPPPTLTCESGYELTGTGSVTPSCNSSALFAPGKVCTAKACPAFVPGANQIVTPTTGVSFPATVVLACNAGYTFVGPGSEVPACNSSGLMASGRGCIAKNCGVFPVAVNQTASTGSNEVSYPTQVMLTCEPGYVASGSALAVDTPTCNASGVFDEWRDCIGDVCGQYPPANFTIVPFLGVTNFPRSVTLSCLIGYEIIGPTTAHCNTSAQWDLISPCTGVPCPSYNVGSNQTATPSSGVQFPHTTNLNCLPGYELTGPGSATPQCNSSGLFNQGQSCTPKLCPALTPVANRTASGDGTATYPHTVTFQCATGFKFPSGDTELVAACTTAGTLSAVPLCAAKICPPFPTGDHQTVTPVGPIAFPGTAALACDLGYVLTGTGSHAPACNSSGAFDAAQSCAAKSCGIYAIGDHQSASPSTNVLFPGVVTLLCATGYELTGSGLPSPTCNSSGLFDQGQLCTARVCGDFPVVSNQTATPAVNVSFPTTVVLACNPGYVLTAPGSATPQCDNTGNFEVGMTCPPRVCPAIAGVANGTLLPLGDMTFPGFVNLTCLPGFTFTLAGNPTPTCNTSGRFDPVAGCEPVSCGVYPAPLNSTISTTSNVEFPNTVTITCDPGFNTVGPGSLTPACMSSLVFEVGATCTPKVCGIHPAVANAVVAPPGPVTFPDSAAITCNPGYGVAPGGGSSIPRCTTAGAFEAAVSCTDLNECEFAPDSCTISISRSLTQAHLVLHDGRVFFTGSGSTSHLRTPIPFPALPEDNRVREVHATHASQLFRTAKGHVYAMGDNSAGQLGLGDTFSRTTPTIIPDTVLAPASHLSTGQLSGGYVTVNTSLAFVFGKNSGSHRIGVSGAFTDRTTPTMLSVSGGLPVTGIRMGYTTGFITVQEKAYAFGNPADGEGGQGATTFLAAPTIVTGSLASADTQDIVAHRQGTSFVTKSGSDRLWGAGRGLFTGIPALAGSQYGPLAVTPAPFPFLPAGVGVVGIDGDDNTLFMGTDNLLYGFGSNTNFILSLNASDANPRLTPQRVTIALGVSPVIRVACSDTTASVVTQDGRMFAWGKNDVGQLGTGDTIDRVTPTFISIPTCQNNRTALCARDEDGGTCSNSVGGHVCGCKPGFLGSNEFEVCTNINECAQLIPTACSAAATCTDSPGSFSCVCNSGFTGDGLVCNEVVPTFTLGNVFSSSEFDVVQSPDIKFPLGDVFIPAPLPFNGNLVLNLFEQRFRVIHEAGSGASSGPPRPHLPNTTLATAMATKNPTVGPPLVWVAGVRANSTYFVDEHDLNSNITVAYDLGPGILLPLAARVTASGYLWIGYNNPNGVAPEIRIFNTITKQLVGDPIILPFPSGTFSGITVVSTNNVWVFNSGEVGPSIVLYNDTGTITGTFGGGTIRRRALLQTQLECLTALATPLAAGEQLRFQTAVHPDGTTWVSRSPPKAIFKITPAGTCTIPYSATGSLYLGGVTVDCANNTVFHEMVTPTLAQSVIIAVNGSIQTTPILVASFSNILQTDNNCTILVALTPNKCLNQNIQCDTNSICNDETDPPICDCKTGFIGNGLLPGNLGCVLPCDSFQFSTECTTTGTTTCTSNPANILTPLCACPDGHTGNGKALTTAGGTGCTPPDASTSEATAILIGSVVAGVVAVALLALGVVVMVTNLGAEAAAAAAAAGAGGGASAATAVLHHLSPLNQMNTVKQRDTTSGISAQFLLNRR